MVNRCPVESSTAFWSSPGEAFTSVSVINQKDYELEISN